MTEREHMRRTALPPHLIAIILRSREAGFDLKMCGLEVRSVLVPRRPPIGSLGSGGSASKKLMNVPLDLHEGGKVALEFLSKHALLLQSLSFAKASKYTYISHARWLAPKIQKYKNSVLQKENAIVAIFLTI